jgi:hypothetical protein
MLSRLLGAIALVMAFACAAEAQNADATLTGYVTDPSGAAVPNAKVALKNSATGVVVNTKSNGTGFYTFPYVVPGSYEISVDATGFQPQVHPDITVQVGLSVRTDFTLQVGSSQQTVTVTGGAPLLQTDNATVGTVISPREVNELPLNGRNPLSLVALAPGVIPQGQAQQNAAGTNNSAFGNYQIGGGVANQSQWLLDGATMVTPFGHAVELLPSQDVIREFNVQTNSLGAEYGGFAGGVVNMSTRSGTNQLHGDIYEFLRNKVLNSNNFFNNAHGIPTAAFTQNQFGATLGGPVVIPKLYNGKNKTFFFINYEGFRLRQGLPALLSVPTQAMRNGDFSALGINIYNPFTTVPDPNNPKNYLRQQASCNGQLNVICPNRIDPVAARLVSLWALPNVPGAGYINNWAGNVSYGGNTDQGTARVDQTISEKQQLFVRYTYWNDLDLAADAFGNQTYAGNLGTPETYNTLQAVVGDTYSFSPSTVMDVHADILRFVYARTPQSIGFDATSIGWPSYFNQQVAPQVRTLPNICLQNYSEFCGGSTGSVLDAWDTSIGIHASVTTTHGRHTVQFGGEWRAARQNYGQTNNGTGGYNFNQTFTAADPVKGAGGGFDFASFLYGTPSTASVQEPAFTASQQIYRAGFVQDTYKATNSLTLTLGLRYEVTGPWTERFNRISVFLPTTPSPLATATGLPLVGSVGLVNTPQRPDRTAVNTNYKEFSPHVGLAYLVGANTTLRAGYGIFWLPIDVNLFSAPDHDSINAITESMNTSLDGGITPYNVLSNPFPNGIIPPPQRSTNPNLALYGQGITTQIPGNPLGYAQQWNFDIQHQFGPTFLIDAAYVGSKGTHLPIQTQSINYLPASLLTLQNYLLAQTNNPFQGKVPVTSPFNTPTISNGQLLRRFPQFGSVTLASQGSGDSVYESFQLKIRKNFGAGGTALLAYTNSKLIGDVESLSPWLESYGPAGYQYWGNLRLERSLSSYDVPQRLVMSYVADLPVGKGKRFLSNARGLVQAVAGGWGLDGTVTLQSGFPLALTTSQNNTHDLGGGSRPNYVPQNCPNGYYTRGSAESRLNAWFNTACFTQPDPFTFGNLSRTMPNLRQDSLSNWDFALFKSFGFGERWKLQLRGETFNLFNTPQFGAPNTSLGSKNFGTVTSQANQPRLIQVAMKLMW